MAGKVKNYGADAFNTLTVRNIPHEVDITITAQAKAAGKSKSDFVQEFLVATFGDLIGNFSRTSELVDLMDREVAKLTGRTLASNWYDSDQIPMWNRIICNILTLRTEEDLQRLMIANMPYLELRAGQALAAGLVPFLPQGVSLNFALFTEAASRDEVVVANYYRQICFMMDRERFYAEVNDIRAARKLEPLVMPEF